MAVPRKRERDNQRSRVYKAERMAGIFDDSVKVGDMTLDQCKLLVYDILHDPRVRARYGAHRVEVKDGRGCRSAMAAANGKWIKLPLWSRQRGVVIHEVAHCLAANEVRHGPRFTRVFLYLVALFMGQEHADSLWNAFEACGVKVWGGFPSIERAA